MTAMMIPTTTATMTATATIPATVTTTSIVTASLTEGEAQALLRRVVSAGFPEAWLEEGMSGFCVTGRCRTGDVTRRYVFFSFEDIAPHCRHRNAAAARSVRMAREDVRAAIARRAEGAATRGGVTVEILPLETTATSPVAAAV